jgi:hypothetical protein
MIVENLINTDLPTENTKDKVEHEEAAHHNKRDEENPVEHAAHGIICLNIKNIYYAGFCFFSV